MFSLVVYVPHFGSHPLHTEYVTKQGILPLSTREQRKVKHIWTAVKDKTFFLFNIINFSRLCSGRSARRDPRTHRTLTVVNF